MHPAGHRGLRELYVMTRRLRDHWRTLAGRLQAGAPAQAQLLREGSDRALALIRELTAVTAARDLYGRPAAQGLGARLAGLHSTLIDPTLDLNQTLRLAILDVVHMVTLLDYLTALAARDADPELERFLAGWAAQMRTYEEAIRPAAVALADDPDRAIDPSTPGIAGRLGHGAATAIGTVGEWVDRRAAR